MPKRLSQYQEDILAIMQSRGVDNLEAERIYRLRNVDQELDPAKVKQLINEA